MAGAQIKVHLKVIIKISYSSVDGGNEKVSILLLPIRNSVFFYFGKNGLLSHLYLCSYPSSVLFVSPVYFKTQACDEKLKRKEKQLSGGRWATRVLSGPAYTFSQGSAST